MSTCRAASSRSAVVPQGVRTITKPLDGAALAGQVREYLKEKAGGQCPGMTPLGLLQVLHQERKSCTMMVSSEARVGLIHLIEGEFVHAQSKEAEAEVALFQILSWRDSYIRLLQPLRDCHISINAPAYLLMEALRQGAARMSSPLSVPEGKPPRLTHPVPGPERLKDAQRTRGWSLHAARRASGAWQRHPSGWHWVTPWKLGSS
jgi:hypothetical protein